MKWKEEGSLIFLIFFIKSYFVNCKVQRVVSLFSKRLFMEWIVASLLDTLLPVLEELSEW